MRGALNPAGLSLPEDSCWVLDRALAHCQRLEDLIALNLNTWEGQMFGNTRSPLEPLSGIRVGSGGAALLFTVSWVEVTLNVP